MKVIRAAIVCPLLLLSFGCNTWQKPGATGIEINPPEPEELGRLVRHDAGMTKTPPLKSETPVQLPPYNIPRSLRRPPHVAGKLDVKLGRTWKYIIIHHSGPPGSGSEAIFDRVHREQNHWLGVGYDFVIGNGRGSSDGLVEVTFRWEQQKDGAHAGPGLKEYNGHGIGICLVGNFEKGHPTAKQMEALVGLVNYLQERCRIPTANILLHRHIRPGGTLCPGKNFPFYEFVSRLAH